MQFPSLFVKENPTNLELYILQSDKDTARKISEDYLDLNLKKSFQDASAILEVKDIFEKAVNGDDSKFSFDQKNFSEIFENLKNKFDEEKKLIPSDLSKELNDEVLNFIKEDLSAFFIKSFYKLLVFKILNTAIKEKTKSVSYHGNLSTDLLFNKILYNTAKELNLEIDYSDVSEYTTLS